MRKYSVYFLLLFILIQLFIVMNEGVGKVFAYSFSEENAVLKPANNIFVALKNRHYKEVWSLLTTTSKIKIINSICDLMIKKFNQKCNKIKLINDFKNGGKNAAAYWNSYLKYFDPNIVLNESQWKIKSIKNKKAIISIKYKDAPNPFLLYLTKEDGKWKVGLLESVLK